MKKGALRGALSAQVSYPAFSDYAAFGSLGTA